MRVMNQLINSIVFLLGAILTVRERIKFEKKVSDYDPKYVALYREHNTMLIIVFTALFATCIYNVISTH